MSEYTNPTDILNLFKLSHIQLDVVLKGLKNRIDKQYEQFRSTLISSLNNLNFIRYHQSYPNDDFKFIYTQKYNVSLVESKVDHKQQILKRMKQYSIIKHDTGGINDNCIYQISKYTQSKQPILNFQYICPTGFTFLEIHQEIIQKNIQFWKPLQGNQNNFNQLFQDLSPVFPRNQIIKLGAIFSQQNKKILNARLLFRASQHNFQSSAFKQSCNGRSPTLMIAKSQKNKIFGAFTPAKWLNTKQKQYIGDPTASSFLFSLDNNLVFPIKRNQLDYAISAFGGWGPIYGSPYGPDLSISDKCHLNDNSCSSLGSHYQIPINVKQYSNEAFSLLAGSKKFKVIQYQVYQLILQ